MQLRKERDQGQGQGQSRGQGQGQGQTYQVEEEHKNEENARFRNNKRGSFSDRESNEPEDRPSKRMRVCIGGKNHEMGTETLRGWAMDVCEVVERLFPAIQSWVRSTNVYTIADLVSRVQIHPRDSTWILEFFRGTPQEKDAVLLRRLVLAIRNFRTSLQKVVTDKPYSARKSFVFALCRARIWDPCNKWRESPQTEDVDIETICKYLGNGERTLPIVHVLSDVFQYCVSSFAFLRQQITKRIPTYDPIVNRLRLDEVLARYDWHAALLVDGWANQNHLITSEERAQITDQLRRLPPWFVDGTSVPLVLGEALSVSRPHPLSIPLILPTVPLTPLQSRKTQSSGKMHSKPKPIQILDHMYSANNWNLVACSADGTRFLARRKSTWQAFLMVYENVWRPMRSIISITKESWSKKTDRNYSNLTRDVRFALDSKTFTCPATLFLSQAIHFLLRGGLSSRLISEYILPYMASPQAYSSFSRDFTLSCD